MLPKPLISGQVLNRPSWRIRILKREDPIFPCYVSNRSTLSRERIHLVTLIVLVGKLRGHRFWRWAVHILLDHKLDSVCLISCVAHLHLLNVIKVLLLVASSETILDWQSYHRLRLLFEICLLALRVELLGRTNVHYIRLQRLALMLARRHSLHRSPSILVVRIKLVNQPKIDSFVLGSQSPAIMRPSLNNADPCSMGY